MLDTREYFEFIRSLGIEFFSGVPDSLLKSFCGYINDNVKDDHIISANEGNAIGMAIGYHIASGKIPLVYMQNSGLGNAVNPIISLADKEIYSIPMLIMIGWRGEPGKKDEPQHLKQGRVMISMLEAMELEYFIISGNAKQDYDSTRKAYDLALETSTPVAIVVTKDAFSSYSYNKINNNKIIFPVNSREEALKSIIKTIPSDSLVVSTTGMISREIFEARESLKQGHEKDFLTVGGMGHASSIAYTLSKYSSKSRMTFCIDGDGAAIMHMGALSNIGNSGDKNFKHILINNGCHDSVGGQETLGFDIDFEKLVSSLGYNFVQFKNQISLEENILSLVNACGPSFLEIKVPPGSRANLGRPTTSPVENKIAMKKFLRD